MITQNGINSGINKSAATPNNDNIFPMRPRRVDQTGVDVGFLYDLVLKTVYVDTDCSTERMSEKLKLSMSITEELMQLLYQDRLIEKRGQINLGNYRYAMLEHGWTRAQHALKVSSYIGPAPVSLQDYNDMVIKQSAARQSVTPSSVLHAMSHLVLTKSTLQILGLVASSRRSLFMTGPAGNGKTTIATALHEAQQGDIWIPYAIEIDNQVIKVFDRHNHEPVSMEGYNEPYDERWIKIKRPLVIVGGEMTIETMDLIYSPAVNFYEAPFQLKANGGTLVIDDFGRQRVDPTDLLNRWITPLEGKVDYLTLHTGKKIAVPFEQMLVFATNLNPSDLVDDAFLRRMGYRLLISAPDKAAYSEIFRLFARKNGLTIAQSLLDYIFKLYEAEKRPLRGCEPRDLLQRCADLCRFENRAYVIDKDLVEVAWRSYFGSFPEGVSA